MSGRVRDAFRAKGHDAWSCDTQPTLADPRWHLQTKLQRVIRGGRWDMLVAFPPCTYLSNMGNARGYRKSEMEWAALNFVYQLMTCGIPRICIENPSGQISTRLRKPDQIINPYQFGNPWSKRTCLWLDNLPPLTPTNIVKSNGSWTEFNSNGSRDRAMIRSLTFPGIASAMADQWG